MNIDLVPLVSFVLVTTFTPGPNNISCASMGVLHGYGKTFRYIAGIATGFFMIMLLCAFVSSSLLKFLPSAEPVLRIVGAVYILWLAFGTARATYAFGSTGQSPMGFKKGFFLQTLNPKVVIYGLTLYSTFLSNVSGNHLALVAFALLFALTAFCAVSTWTLCGAAIRTHLHQPGIRKLINTVLVLLLVYTAFDISRVGLLIG